MKICTNCHEPFSILPEDLKVYQVFDVPPPLMCPNCRQQLRTLHINQLNLFIRTCDATGARIVSHYPVDVPFPVHSQAHWYSDAVENTSFALDFDFSRPFFEQFAALQRAVPRPALFTDFLRDENSAFTNYAGKNKDCYLIFDSDGCRSCSNSYSINSCTDVSDCYRGDKLECSLECVDCKGCYGSAYLFNCENCTSSAFLANCIGCSDCLLSSNLKHKRFFVMNEEVCPEDYARLRSALGASSTLREVSATFEAFRKDFPQKFLRGFQNENVLGNYLFHCRDAFSCFDCRDLREGRYCFQTFMKVVNGMDLDECGDGELLFECSNLGYNAYHVRFSMNCLNQIRDLTYCDMCFNGCSDLFGCVGLKKKSFCVLNKPYTETEYRALIPRVIRHMKETGEWGSFFPAALSPFGYNLTVANSFFPLTKDAALAKGYGWHQQLRPSRAPEDRRSPPELLKNVEDSALLESYDCTSCGQGFKLVKSELNLHRTLGIALPVDCFQCRHRRRLSSRAPRKLWGRNCENCQVPLSTAYDPSGSDIVYCEDCYLDSLE